jgi:Mg2+/citrate symporter
MKNVISYKIASIFLALVLVLNFSSASAQKKRKRVKRIQKQSFLKKTKIHLKKLAKSQKDLKK